MNELYFTKTISQAELKLIGLEEKNKYSYDLDKKLIENKIENHEKYVEKIKKENQISRIRNENLMKNLQAKTRQALVNSKILDSIQKTEFKTFLNDKFQEVKVDQFPKNFIEMRKTFKYEVKTKEMEIETIKNMTEMQISRHNHVVNLEKNHLNQMSLVQMRLNDELKKLSELNKNIENERNLLQERKLKLNNLNKEILSDLVEELKPYQSSLNKHENKDNKELSSSQNYGMVNQKNELKSKIKFSDESNNEISVEIASKQYLNESYNNEKSNKKISTGENLEKDSQNKHNKFINDLSQESKKSDGKNIEKKIKVISSENKFIKEEKKDKYSDEVKNNDYNEAEEKNYFNDISKNNSKLQNDSINESHIKKIERDPDNITEVKMFPSIIKNDNKSQIDENQPKSKIENKENLNKPDQNRKDLSSIENQLKINVSKRIITFLEKYSKTKKPSVFIYSLKIINQMPSDVLKRHFHEINENENFDFNSIDSETLLSIVGELLYSSPEPHISEEIANKNSISESDFDNGLNVNSKELLNLLIEHLRKIIKEKKTSIQIVSNFLSQKIEKNQKNQPKLLPILEIKLSGNKNNNSSKDASFESGFASGGFNVNKAPQIFKKTNIQKNPAPQQPSSNFDEFD